MQYPYVRYKPCLEPYSKRKKIVPNFPTKPALKDFLPNNGIKQKDINQIWHAGFVFTVIYILFIFFTIEKVEADKFLGLVAIWVCLLITISNYSKRLRETEAKATDGIRMYDLALEEYNCIVDEINKTIQLNASIDDLVKYNEYVRHEELKKISQPVKVESKKGYSEGGFIAELKQNLAHLIYEGDLEIVEGVGIEHNLDEYEHLRSFQLDIVLYHKESGMFFDIEIDEPYTLEEGKPIHCYDFVEDYNENRDSILTENHTWIVIRFSEEQVIRFPELCTKFILGNIARFTFDEKYYQFGQQISSFDLHEVLPISRWRGNDARRMADENFRERYLKIESIRQSRSKDYLPF